MERRKFLIGTAGAAIGGSALVGSGAFSRVESQRTVNIEVAKDEDAYLGLVPLDTPNSQNYVAHDEYGHLYVQIDGEGDQQEVGGDGPEGEGVNSNSRTWFEGMFDICNQGKDTATIWIDVADLNFHPSVQATDGINDKGEPVADVYYKDGDDEVSILRDSSDDSWQPDAGITLETGQCETMHIKTSTFGVNATEGSPLVEGTATIVADAPGAGSPQ